MPSDVKSGALEIVVLRLALERMQHIAGKHLQMVPIGSAEATAVLAHIAALESELAAANADAARWESRCLDAEAALQVNP